MATSLLTAQELNRKLNQLFSLERKTTAQIVECLLEIKRRRTYLEFGYTGLFSYLTKHFKHTEATAQRWIECVKMAEKLPEISDDLKSGALNQTQVCLLSQALREKKRQEKKQQRHEQKQEKNEMQQPRQGQEEKPGQAGLGLEENQQQQIKNQEERVIAHSNDLLPQIAKNLLPKIRNQTASQTQVLLSRSLDLPLKQYEKKSYQKDESIRLEITLTKEQMKQIERVKELLSHKYPHLNMAELISVLVQEVIQQRDPLVKKVIVPISKTKTCNHSDTFKMEVPAGESQCMPTSNLKTNSTGSQNMAAASLEAFSKNSQRAPAFKLKVPSKVLTGSSHSKSHRAIPRWVQRAVYQRDLCCQWKMQDESQDKAQICGSKFQLQLDHIQPRWAGGTDEVHNLQLLCATHNRQKYQREAGIKRL